MGMSIEREKICTFIVQILIAIICISNCTVFGTMGNNLYYTTITLVVFWSVLYRRLNFRFVSKRQFLFVLILIYNICFGVIVGSDSSAASTLLIYYFLGFLIYVVEWEIESLYAIIKILKALTLVIAASIILEAVMIDVILPLVYVFSAGSEKSILNEIAYGAYSGFAGEKADAAFYMNILFLITICSCIHKRKVAVKDGFVILLSLIALMLTGKRTLFMTIFVIAFILFMNSDIRFKGFKIFMIALVVAAVVFSIPKFFPQANFLFERLGDTSESGRSELWNYAIQMFKENPIFGMGLGSYNDYIFKEGYINPFTGGKWFAQCHCIYLQILGELGIVGSILMICLFLSNLYKAFFLMKHAENNTTKLMSRISLALQLLVLIYGITGNTMYYPFQIVLYGLSIAISETAYRNYSEEVIVYDYID